MSGGKGGISMNFSIAPADPAKFEADGSPRFADFIRQAAGSSSSSSSSSGGAAAATQPPGKKRKGKYFDIDADALKAQKREKNKVHARESRIRKMYKVSLMLERLKQLWATNRKLKAIIMEELPEEGEAIIISCLVPGTSDFNPSDTESQKFITAEEGARSEDDVVIEGEEVVEDEEEDDEIDEYHDDYGIGDDSSGRTVRFKVGQSDNSNSNSNSKSKKSKTSKIVSPVAADLQRASKTLFSKNTESSELIASKLVNYVNAVPDEVITSTDKTDRRKTSKK